MHYWSRVTRLISLSALRTRDPARLSCLTAVTFLGDAPKAGEKEKYKYYLYSSPKGIGPSPHQSHDGGGMQPEKQSRSSAEV